MIPGEPQPGAPGAPISVWEYYRSRLAMTTERIEAYRDYCEMDYDDLIAPVLEAGAEDCTQSDFMEGKIVWVVSENKEIERIIRDLLERLEIETIAPLLIRELAKFGDCFERVWYARGEGVTALEHFEPNRVFRVEEEGRLRGFSIDQEVNPTMTMQSPLLNPWDFIHFIRSAGRRGAVRYGDAWIRPARRLFRKLQMMEDAIIMYRLRRAPDRNVFYIDIGEAPASEAPAIVRMWRRLVKKNVFYKPNET